MKKDVNGCSTCPKGKESYECFEYRGKKFVQYDYRHTNGDLFSCVASNLEACREKKNKWLEV